MECRCFDRFVADKDIKVYKYVRVVDDSHWAGACRYNKLKFCFDKTEKPENCRRHKECVEFVPYAGNVAVNYVIRVGKGWFHSFRNISDCFAMYSCFEKPILCSCTIPKGTVCYMNETEIASKSIIVHKPKNLKF